MTASLALYFAALALLAAAVVVGARAANGARALRRLLPRPIRDVKAKTGPALFTGHVAVVDGLPFAPLSGRPAAMLSLALDEKAAVGYRLVKEKTSRARLVVADGSGAIEVDMPRAELRLEAIVPLVRPFAELAPPARQKLVEFLALDEIKADRVDKLRVTQHALVAGAQVHVTGVRAKKRPVVVRGVLPLVVADLPWRPRAWPRALLALASFVVATAALVLAVLAGLSYDERIGPPSSWPALVVAASATEPR